VGGKQAYLVRAGNFKVMPWGPVRFKDAKATLENLSHTKHCPKSQDLHHVLYDVRQACSHLKILCSPYLIELLKK
jgi:hypothetical protein